MSRRLSHTLLRSSRRSLSTIETPDFKPPPRPSSNLGLKVGTLFTGLTILGVSVTAYGLYEYYTSFSTWHPELRDDLRAAIKSKNRGDARRAESFFRKALEKAKVLAADDKLGRGSKVLKVSGISIALGSLLEDEGQFKAAYEIYEEALQEVKGGENRSGEERMRAVAIAQRMGDLAQLDNVAQRSEVTGTVKSDDAAERALVWSVEELLRLALPTEVCAKALAGDDQVSLNGEPTPVSEEDKILITDLKLPPWVTQQEIGASIEALGAFYASRGVTDYAVPLYLQALSILMPPKGSRKQPPTVADRCRAAVLMNNLSQLFVNGKPNVEQGKAWANKGLEIADITIRKAGFDGPPPENSSVKVVEQSSEERTQQVRMECLRVQITLLFNLGVMSQMTLDVCSARKFYQRAYKQAQIANLSAAKQRCAQALSRLERSTQS